MLFAEDGRTGNHPAPSLATQFQNLVAACDALLTAPDAHESWLASPFLHVLSGHPLLVERYRKAIARAVRPRFLRWDVSDAIALRRLVRSIAAPVVPDLGARDVLLVGGLVNADHLDRSEDFYFGHAQSELAARGVRTLLLLRNQTGTRAGALRRRALRAGPAGRLLLPDVASLGEELSSRRSAAAGRKAMLASSMARSHGVDTNVLCAAAADVGSVSTVANLVLERQIERICRQARPSLVITMYEGHAWERCVWRGARRANPQMICGGYQHTVLRELSHAVRRNLGGPVDPDILLCLGEITKTELEHSPKLASVEFLVLGTHRRERPEHEPSEPVRRKPCLVMPEGMEVEAELLFRFAASAARAAPDVLFILRSHPVLPFQRVASRVPELITLPPNVEVSSERSLSEDLQRSGRVLYRGTNAAIYGILGGLKPYYVEQPGELTLDPVYALETWREKVRSADGLALAFRQDDARDDAARMRDWQTARAFCHGYTRPEQPEAFDRLAALARSRT